MSAAAFTRIKAGLEEVRAIVRGEAEPASIHIAVPAAPMKKGGAPGSARPIQDIAMLNVEGTTGAIKQKREKPGINRVFHTKSDTAAAAAWLNTEVAASGGEVRAKVIDLTPALASVLLDRNEGNRSIKERRVRDYVRDVVAGDWKLNGEPIIVSSDGMLNDGQHRCAAVLQAGKPISTLFIIGVARETRDTVDHGAGRSPGDDLGLHGFKNTVALAAAARMLWQWRKYGDIQYSGNKGATRVELIQTAEENPGLAKSLSMFAGKGAKAKALASPSLLAFCHFAFKTVATDADVSYFFDALIDGADMKRGDPILNARNRLLTDGRIFKPGDKAELLFRAWNAHRRGETARVAFRLSGGELPMLES